MKTLQPKRLLFLLALLWPASQALALEVQPFAGNLNYSSMDGCCISTGNKVGFGILARLQTDNTEEWDVMGYTDKRWSEFSVMKPTYLMGKKNDLDPSEDQSIQIRRLSDFKLIFSYGGGFFIHSTRTKNYDLPAISSGVSLLSVTQAVYTFNDHLAAVAMGQLSLSLGIDDKGYLWGLFLGVNWRP